MSDPTPLEVIRKKKFDREPLTALELVIWEAYRKGYEDVDKHQLYLAETAANELAHLQERIKEHLPK